YLGGLVGFNASTSGSSVLRSYAMGMVTHSGTVSVLNKGGLIGRNGATAGISTTYATGYVTGSGAEIGGLIGNNLGGTITSAYWDTQTTGQSTSAGGTAATTADLQSTMPAGFNTSDWNLQGGRSYAYLNWQA